MKPARVLVVGGGWVGSRLVDQLRQRSVDVATWSPTSIPPGPRREQGLLVALQAGRAVPLSDTVVINAAGRQYGDESSLVRANVTFASWLAASCERSGLRLVHIGSAAEYGPPVGSARLSESSTCRPTSTYGVTKLAGTSEVLGSTAAGTVTVVRPFNLVGPGAPPASPVAQFADDVAALPSGGGVVRVGWPETIRDVITVGQLAESILALIGIPTWLPLVNVCSGSGVSFGSVVGSLARRRGVAVEVETMGQPGIVAVVGDPSLLRSATGSSPTPLTADDVARAVWPEPVVQSGS